MAAETNFGKLSELKRQIYLANINGEQFNSAPFVVISIHRYLSDPRHCVQAGVTGSQGSVLDVIQLTVADSQNKAKLILSPELNKLVQCTELQVGHAISITRARLHHDETDLTGSQVVIVEQLDIEAHRDTQDIDVTGLSWLDGSSHLEQMDIPLTSTRGYYVSVWSSMEMYGSIWKTAVPHKPCLESIKVEDIYSIKDVARRWNNLRATNSALLVRVLMKSRVLHYAKPHKNDKWPFQAHVLVGDESGTCTLVLWNAMCPNLYYSLEEGTVLLLQKFTVKKSFQLPQRFKPAMTSDLEHFGVDLNLNSHHPASEVTIVDPGTVPDRIHLPSVTRNFVKRRQAGGLIDNCKCDIVGVVTYVGRYEREPMASKVGKDYGGFYVRRWLHLMDSSSNKPFVVQLYRPTEGMRDLDILPGVVLMCSHVMVLRKLETVQNSRSQHATYFTSTAETQTRIVDAALQRELADEGVVTDVLKWSRSQQCQDRLTEATVGGYYNVPVPYCSLEQLRNMNKDQQILGSEEWQPLLSSLAYRECRQIFVKANMVHVKACLHHRSNRGSKGSPKKKTKLSEPECSVDDNMDSIYKNLDGMTVLGTSQLDPDISFPIKYSSDWRQAIKEKLQFPACELEHVQSQDGNDELPDPLPLSYFTVTWIGLNTQVLLQTHLLCPPDIPTDLQLSDFISRPSWCQLSARPESIPPPTVSQAERLVASVTQCSGKQFALMLDCYRGDSQHSVEIFLNRSWAID